MQDEKQQPDSAVQVFANRVILAVVSAISGYWAYCVGLRLVEQDDMFKGGDMFVIILAPIYLLVVLVMLGILIFLALVSLLSAIYVVHPPWALRIMKNMNESPK